MAKTKAGYASDHARDHVTTRGEGIAQWIVFLLLPSGSEFDSRDSQIFSNIQCRRDLSTA